MNHLGILPVEEIILRFNTSASYFPPFLSLTNHHLRSALSKFFGNSFPSAMAGPILMCFMKKVPNIWQEDCTTRLQMFSDSCYEQTSGWCSDCCTCKIQCPVPQKLLTSGQTENATKASMAAQQQGKGSKEDQMAQNRDRPVPF